MSLNNDESEFKSKGNFECMQWKSIPADEDQNQPYFHIITDCLRADAKLPRYYFLNKIIIYTSTPAQQQVCASAFSKIFNFHYLCIQDANMEQLQDIMFLVYDENEPDIGAPKFVSRVGRIQFRAVSKLEFMCNMCSREHEIDFLWPSNNYNQTANYNPAYIITSD